jgi:predicted  nucleic acid-binding Zn-ribbon protein
MAKAKPPKNASQEILNRLTALDKKVDKGFKEAGKQFKGIADFRQQTEENFAAVNKRVDEGFKEAAEFRQQTETNFAAINQRMDDEFKTAEQFRQKTKQDFVDTAHNIGEVGSMLYDKIEGHHREFQKFQQETLSFQRRTEDFQQQTSVFQDEMRIFKQKSLNFQDAMQETIQHFTRVMERIEHDLSILREAFDQLKTEHGKLKIENEELKKAKVEHETTIKKLEQRVAMLEAMQN